MIGLCCPFSPLAAALLTGREVPHTEAEGESGSSADPAACRGGEACWERLWEWISLRNWREHLAGTGS